MLKVLFFLLLNIGIIHGFGISSDIQQMKDKSEFVLYLQDKDYTLKTKWYYRMLFTMSGKGMNDFITGWDGLTRSTGGYDRSGKILKYKGIEYESGQFDYHLNCTNLKQNNLECDDESIKIFIKLKFNFASNDKLFVIDEIQRNVNETKSTNLSARANNEEYFVYNTTYWDIKVKFSIARLISNDRSSISDYIQKYTNNRLHEACDDGFSYSSTPKYIFGDDYYVTTHCIPCGINEYSEHIQTPIEDINNEVVLRVQEILNTTMQPEPYYYIEFADNVTENNHFHSTFAFSGNIILKTKTKVKIMKNVTSPSGGVYLIDIIGEEYTQDDQFIIFEISGKNDYEAITVHVTDSKLIGSKLRNAETLAILPIPQIPNKQECKICPTSTWRNTYAGHGIDDCILNKDLDKIYTESLSIISDTNQFQTLVPGFTVIDIDVDFTSNRDLELTMYLQNIKNSVINSDSINKYVSVMPMHMTYFQSESLQKTSQGRKLLSANVSEISANISTRSSNNTELGFTKLSLIFDYLVAMEVKIEMSLPMSITTFDTNKQIEFRTALAIVGNVVNLDDVIIKSIDGSTRSRRILSDSIGVVTIIQARGIINAKSIADQMTTENINSQFAKTTTLPAAMNIYVSHGIVNDVKNTSLASPLLVSVTPTKPFFVAMVLLSLAVYFVFIFSLYLTYFNLPTNKTDSSL